MKQGFKEIVASQKTSTKLITSIVRNEKKKRNAKR